MPRACRCCAVDSIADVKGGKGVTGVELADHTHDRL